MPNEAHLQMIQAVIARLAAQATTVKGWSITVTAALLGYAVTSQAVMLAVIAAYTVLAFASLDAYYLAQERAYRALYREAVTGAAADWDLKAARPGAAQYRAALLSPATFLLHGSSLLIAVAIGATIVV